MERTISCIRLKVGDLHPLPSLPARAASGQLAMISASGQIPVRCCQRGIFQGAAQVTPKFLGHKGREGMQQAQGYIQHARQGLGGTRERAAPPCCKLPLAISTYQSAKSDQKNS